MDTAELSRALHDATAGLNIPPGFADRVRRGGRRRQVRQRMAIAGMTTATAAAMVAAAMAWLPGPRSGPVITAAADDPRLSQPTHGQLAGDQAFTDRALAAWHRDLPTMLDAESGKYAGDRGKAHLYWAGNTPAGPAAVVLQLVRLSHGEGPEPGKPDTGVAIGLVGTDPTDHALHVLTADPEQVGRLGTEDPAVFAFGPGDRTVLVLSNPNTQVISEAPDVDPATGKVSRQWTKVPFTDDVAVLNLDDNPNAAATTVMLLPGPPPALPPGAEVRLGEMPVIAGQRRAEATGNLAAATMPDPRLTWTGFNPGLNGARPADTAVAQLFQRTLVDRGFDDPYASGKTDGYWHITVPLANGQRAVLGEHLIGTHSQLYLMRLDSNGAVTGVDHGGPTDPTSPLPVRFALPANQGWVVAARGATLRGQSADGTWTQPQTDAALLPANTVRVEVTQKGEPPVQITLNH